MTFDEVVARLKAQRTGDAWLARCPSHDDRTAVKPSGGRGVFIARADIEKRRDGWGAPS